MFKAVGVHTLGSPNDACYCMIVSCGWELSIIHVCFMRMRAKAESSQCKKLNFALSLFIGMSNGMYKSCEAVQWDCL